MKRSGGYYDYVNNDCIKQYKIYNENSYKPNELCTENYHKLNKSMKKIPENNFTRERFTCWKTREYCKFVNNTKV